MNNLQIQAAVELERRRRRRYVARGSNADVQTATEREVLISGAAGTGKSRAWLERIHRDALNYPGARQLIIRETRASLTESVLVTFERDVLGANHPLVADGASRAHRQAYHYPNGSEIALGGMDNPTRVLSTEFDRIYFPEAIETELDKWETLLTRLRNGVLPVQQLGADTNPTFPLHWLKQRCDSGRTRLIFARHEDNPLLYDAVTETWTPEGIAYIETLDSLTGVRRERLRYGRWVQAEGVIFDNWDEALNVTPDADYRADTPIIWGVDDGYAMGGGVGTASYHPRVILFLHVTAQGGVDVFDEYVAAGELSETTITNALERGYHAPDAAYVDSSAQELKQRIWNAGIMSANGTHPVSEGIKNVRRLVCDGRGVRLLRVHPRCKNLIREMSSYRYDSNSRGVDVGEPKPLKQDDHTISSLRYACWHLR